VRTHRGRRLGVESVVLHLLAAAVVGVAWWWLAPELTYTVFEGQAFVLEETRYTTIFGGDATFTLLGAVAGAVCAGVLLLRGYRGPVLAVVLAVLGTLGSALAWWLAVTLGPGRLDDIAAAAGEGNVLAGPELNAYASGLVWPIVAVATIFVVTAFSEPDRTRRRRLHRSAE
jgi:hypothetical protein